VITHSVVFGQAGSPISWHGKLATDANEVRAYLRGGVLDRLRDIQALNNFEDDCLDLSGTGMARDTLKMLLCSERLEREPWEIGEALAECLLGEDGASWPWNKERDKRTPQASLPGADLVGFVKADDKILLAIGEVKTSSDTSTPPNVMQGRCGMIYQLESIATDRSKHLCILRGLHHRCQNTEYYPMWQEAVTNYLNTDGKDIVLFGVLVRDTPPHPLRGPSSQPGIYPSESTTCP
jgi:hypothetical protein